MCEVAPCLGDEFGDPKIVEKLNVRHDQELVQSEPDPHMGNNQNDTERRPSEQNERMINNILIKYTE